jgi:hypothetical protein
LLALFLLSPRFFLTKLLCCICAFLQVNLRLFVVLALSFCFLFFVFACFDRVYLGLSCLETCTLCARVNVVITRDHQPTCDMCMHFSVHNMTNPRPQRPSDPLQSTSPCSTMPPYPTAPI